MTTETATVVVSGPEAVTLVVDEARESLSVSVAPARATVVATGAMGPPGSDADVTDHEAGPDPHPGYRLESVPIAAVDVAADVATQAELDGHTGAAAPHVGHETPAGAQARVDAHRDVAAPHADHLTVAHTVAGDPHPGYRLEADSPVDPVAAAAGLRTLGAGDRQAAAGDDSRLVGAAPKLYVQSRGENLITNGSGLLGTTENFSSLSFDPADAPGGKGSFFSTLKQAVRFSDELLPVDPELMYELSAWGKSNAAGQKQYLGIAPYDIDGLQQSPVLYTRYATDPRSRLTADLVAGATFMQVDTVAGWEDAPTAHRDNINFGGYVSASGFLYPDYTYSRRTVTNILTGPGVVDAVNLRINLNKPWPGPTYPAGTAVWPTFDAGTFKYIAVNRVEVPAVWTFYAGHIGRVDTAGSANQRRFPLGCAFIKLLFLVNYPPVPAGDARIAWGLLSFGIHPRAIKDAAGVWRDQVLDAAGVATYPALADA
jgi:hypothetical protein